MKAYRVRYTNNRERRTSEIYSSNRKSERIVFANKLEDIINAINIGQLTVLDVTKSNYQSVENIEYNLDVFFKNVVIVSENGLDVTFKEVNIQGTQNVLNLLNKKGDEVSEL